MKFLPAILLAALAPAATRADTFTWKGGGLNNNWGTAANWHEGIAPAVDFVSTDLIFGDTASFIFPSITPAYAIRSLTFSANAPGYTFDSGPLYLRTGGLTQNSPAGQGFSAPVVLDANQTWSLVGAGGLTFGGGVNTTGRGNVARTLTLATAGAGNTINGNITGNGALIKTGAGTLTLSGVNPFTGGFKITAGTVAFAAGSALGTGVKEIEIGNGELRATATTSIDNRVVRFAESNSTGAVTAAPGTTLTLNSVVFIQPGTVIFGSSTQTGTIVITGDSIGATMPTSAIAFAINGGILRAGASALPSLLALSGAGTTVAAGAILDLDGFETSLPGLSGAGTVRIGGGAATTLTVASGSFSGIISGLGKLTKNGAGNLLLSGENLFNGETTVSAGTLIAGATGTEALGDTSKIAVTDGGTLLLAGSNQINNSAPLTLGGGTGTPTFATGGFSETLGTLTLSSHSILDLGNSASILNFANSRSQTWSGTLSIYNWSGNLAGTGADRVFFGTDGSGLMTSQLAQISFFSGTGTGSFGAGAQMLSNGQIVPVPEPGPVFAVLALAGLIGYRERKRLAGLWR